MLGLVIAGNVAMVFVFWELVGICSYLLIGFYIERHSASNAANKAFIVNRVGDFGMIIGLMAVWTGLGTFSFGDVNDAQGHVTRSRASSARSGRRPTTTHWSCPTAWSRLAAATEIDKIVRATRRRTRPRRQIAAGRRQWRQAGLRLLAAGRRRAGHFLRLRGQERPVPAARLAARRDGRPHARQRA